MALVLGMTHLLKIEVMKILLPCYQRLLGTCQKLAGGERETEGGSPPCETQKRERS